MDTNFAEFFGIMLGDGCIFSRDKTICISCNSKDDKEYVLNYVRPLMKRIFNKEPKIYYDNSSNTIRCKLYGKSNSYSIINHGFPVGKKKENYQRIRNVFYSKNIYLIALIRGLNDTDGSVYPHPGAKIILDISIKNPCLLLDIIKAFDVLNYPIKYTKNRIYFIGQKRVKEFFNTFGSSNLKHVTKYHYFLENDMVPTSKETVNLLKDSCINFELPYYGSVV